MPTFSFPLSELPIIQAPMAGVATPQLAAAVCDAGGLGSLGVGAASLEEAERMITATAALTARPFNVNLFCHRPAPPDARRDAAWLDYLAPLFARFDTAPPPRLEPIYPSFTGNDAATAMLLRLKPKVVSFHFGLPNAAQITALKQAGAWLIASATSRDEALQALKAGVDAIVAQGYEAGGHRGVFEPDGADDRLPLADLLQTLRGHVDAPIIAAGGLMSGHDIRAALQMGAVAGQLGTAFVACPEAAAAPAYRAALQQCPRDGTVMTRAISGRPARGLVNALTRHGAAPGAPPVAAYPNAYDAAKRLNAAALAHGDAGYGAWWAGENAGRCRPLPAAVLTRLLADELAG